MSIRLGIVGALVLVTSVLAAAGVALALRARGPAPVGGGHVVAVQEHDFQITLSTHRVPAGETLFRITNHGPDAHELIVVHDNGHLPLRADGMTVNEEALTKQTVGGLEPARAGAVRDLRVNLPPGRYLLLCNMYGHFMAGMHSELIAQ
ncbi:MAG TPA: sulfocyanin-like copper-binding protein [Gaiellaceae bacterium]|nr:sulfocyanin-like copper-binding protein [Gaiellaceae bacterium]